MDTLPVKLLQPQKSPRAGWMQSSPAGATTHNPTCLTLGRGGGGLQPLIYLDQHQQPVERTIPQDQGQKNMLPAWNKAAVISQWWSESPTTHNNPHTS